MIKKIPFDSHEEWLKIRHQYIGGSDAGAVMGMNPYSSPYAVWAEKTGKISGFEGSTITKVGAYLEDLVAQMFMEETGKKVQRCNFTLVNDKYPWACANVDRMLVGEDAVLEIKTTNSFVNVKKFRQGDYPEQWYCQMMHYLAVTEKKKAYLAVLSECKEFRIFELERDEAEIDALMSAEKTFWDKVTNNTPPDVDGSEATSDAISEIYGKSNGNGIDLMGFESLFEQRKQADEAVKQAKEWKDGIDNQIKSAMGAAERAACGKYSVSWKEQKRTSFDYKAFRAANPNINVGPYVSESTSRVFRVTEKRG